MSSQHCEKPTVRGRWRSSATMLDAAKLQRERLTRAEQAVWAVVRPLRSEGYAFRRQFPLEQFVLDFYCPKAKLAVEIDGSIHDSAAVNESDRARQQHLEQTHGITFLRFTNAEVFNSPPSVKNRILQELSRISPNPSNQK